MKIKHTTQGFSLIETLVAISLLLLISVGPMQILRQSANSNQFASEQAVAYFLAQEGIELVHKYRDDLWLQYWLQEFTGSGGITNPMTEFSRDYNNNPLRRCFRNQSCGLYIADSGQIDFVKNNGGNPVACNATNCRLYEATSGRARYTHDSVGNEPTPYTRRINIERIPDTGVPVEFKIRSTVEWRTGSLIAGQRVELETYLMNIYDTN